MEEMQHIHLADLKPDTLDLNPAIETVPVFLPGEDYSFCHESAVFAHKGMIFSAWYCNSRKELHGETPIFWSVSTDGGRTFSEKKLLVTDRTAEILYCPPIFGECGGRLYLMLNEMLRLPDHIHALDLYVLDEKSMTFTFLWSRPIPFKLNTNVYRLENGKLLLPGRIAEPDGFPRTPAVLISDSGKIDAEWRLVKIAPDGNLPNGETYVHPEVSVIAHGSELLAFCRKDAPDILPIVYRSEDYGETWGNPMLWEVPASDSKLYSGRLSDGRDYIMLNLYPGRSRLAFLYTKPGERIFTRGFLLQNGFSAKFPGSGLQWSYPSACETDGYLYVIYTGSLSPDNQAYRGVLMSKIPLSVL